MLRVTGLCLLAVCFISQCSARLSVTIMDRDTTYTGPKEALLYKIQKVLGRMAAVQAAHPRVQRLYELLRQDLRQGSQPGSRHQALDFNKTLRPEYDVNKLNRIYTTEPDFVA